MSDLSIMPDDDAIDFDPAKAKAKRTQDAEKIRQDFIKSRRLPSAPATQRPILEPPKDER